MLYLRLHGDVGARLQYLIISMNASASARCCSADKLGARLGELCGVDPDELQRLRDDGVV